MRVLITGANRGIGAALLARYQGRGDDAFGTHRGAGADRMLSLDLARNTAGADLAAGFGDQPLDLLVCNAGVFDDRGHVLDGGYPAQMWADMFAVNVTGVFQTIQALLPNLRRATGKIAIISSQMASDTHAPGGSYIYRASKAAVLNLGRNLATDLKDEGIAVGIYHPGWVQTDMGGQDAAITTDASADGLVARFDALELARTGCFETWDGRPHDF